MLSDYLADSEHDYIDPNIVCQGETESHWLAEDIPPGSGRTIGITITVRADPSLPTPKPISNYVTLQMDGYRPFEDEVNTVQISY